jgi:hypothetical protein
MYKVTVKMQTSIMSVECNVAPPCHTRVANVCLTFEQPYPRTPVPAYPRPWWLSSVPIYLHVHKGL